MKNKIDLDYLIVRNMQYAILNISIIDEFFDSDKCNNLLLSNTNLFEIIRQSIGGALKDYHDNLKAVLKEQNIDIPDAVFTDLFSNIPKN